MRFALIHTYETTSALKHLRLIFSVILFVLCQSTSIYAQDTSSFSSEGNTENFTQTSEKQQSNKHKRSKLYRFFQNFNAIDTTYIEPNHYNFTAMAQASNLLNFYTIYGKNEDGKKQRISFSTKPRLKVGPYIGWHWAFLGYQFDIGRTHTSNKSQQYNISLYSSTIGIDYIHNTNNGDFYINRAKGFGKENTKNIKDVHFDGLKTYTHSLNLYYIFNHKKFSYPAAFSQTTQQKKSCGSWNMGVVVAHQKLSFDHTKLPSSLLSTENGGTGLYNELKFNNINFYDYSLSFGYAYNWVFAPNWLFAASASPAIGYKFSKGQSIDHKEIFSSHNINFDVIGRVGLVWNTNRFFAGFSGIIHAYTYRKSRFQLSNAIAMTNLYFGINFMPKGHYRRTNPQKFKKW